VDGSTNLSPAFITAITAKEERVYKKFSIKTKISLWNRYYSVYKQEVWNFIHSIFHIFRSIFFRTIHKHIY
jgi:hypothetical protein